MEYPITIVHLILLYTDSHYICPALPSAIAKHAVAASSVENLFSFANFISELGRHPVESLARMEVHARKNYPLE